jgi:formate hydrogenlyase subunit 4
MYYVQWILQLLLVPVVGPLGIGIINKLKAKMQNRQGASIFQPYYNLRKLFHKDEVISKDASWLFRAAPFVVFAVTLIVGTVIPLFSTALHTPASEMLTVVYLLASSTFFLALVGLDTGGGFGGFGASREMTISALAEGGLIFSLLPLALIAGTTDLTAIVQGVAGHYEHFLVPIFLASSGFLVVLLAETKRFPFDNPDTHLELTMVHEAMLLEYSGKRLALMEWAAANKMFIFAVLAVNMFLPYGLTDSSGLNAVLIAVGITLAKALFIYAGVAVLESTIAKFRFFRLPHLLFTAFMLNAIAVGLVVSL